MLVDPLLADLPDRDEPVIALLNGLGGTPLIELYVMYNEAAELFDRSRDRRRTVPGRQLRHLTGDGGLFADPAARRRRTVLDLWDAPVDTAGLRWGR